MSKVVPVRSATLHDALFLNGKNFGLKLSTNRQTGVKLEYDRDQKELLVSWNGTTTHVPNVHQYVIGEEESQTPQIVHPMVAGAAATAQVESPMAHVQAGPGHGKTGKAK